MKQYWQSWSLKIDARTLRERAIIFVMAALILVTLVNTALLDPLYVKQKQLSQSIKQDQAQISAMQAEIQQKAASQSVDPDSANKAKLQQLTQQLSQMQATLQGMQKGLVPPDKVPSLLEDLLRQNGRLRLVSLKTLPASTVIEPPAAGKKTAEANPAATLKESAENKLAGETQTAAGSIYRHGVEVVVQGAYLDLLDYLAQLEAMPWQLYWGSATMDATGYPKVTLKLTLHTLSLDKKWLNI